MKENTIKRLDPHSKIWVKLFEFISGYHHDKYWRRRRKVVEKDSKTNTLLKLYYLFYIKRVDAKFHCTFGTNLNSGATFSTPPLLLHGPSGIIVGHSVKVGKNCTIFQQVTIMHSWEKETIIGDNVILGAGCKILPGVHIGDNAKIGANACVTEDVPSCATVVPQKARIIIKK